MSDRTTELMMTVQAAKSNVLMLDNGARNSAALQQFTNDAEKAGSANKAVTPGQLRLLLADLTGFEDAICYDADAGRIYLREDVDLGPQNMAMTNKKHYVLKAGSLNDETHIAPLMVYLSSFGIVAHKQDLNDAINATAMEHPVHPNLDWIKAMIKNGHYDQQIYKKIIVDWLGAKDEPYSMAWLKSLLASIWHDLSFDGPDNKFMPSPVRYTMFGQQGIGKSAFVQYLTNNNSYEPPLADKNKGLDHPDTMMGIVQAIVVNLDDTAYGSKISATDLVKSFITRPAFTFRKPYGRGVVTMLNRAIWVGSTNRPYAFSDTSSGSINRREYPIELSVGMTSTEASKRGRDIQHDWFKLDEGKGPQTQPLNDLWATFFKDNEVAPIERTFVPGSDLDNVRLENVKNHMKPDTWGDAVDSLLELKVPDNFLPGGSGIMNPAKKIRNSDRIDWITSVIETGENPELNAVNFYSSRPQVPISSWNEIPATLVNKCISEQAGRGQRSSYVDLIAGLMSDRGYDLVRSRVYRKRNSSPEPDKTPDPEPTKKQAPETAQSQDPNTRFGDDKKMASWADKVFTSNVLPTMLKNAENKDVHVLLVQYVKALRANVPYVDNPNENMRISLPDAYCSRMLENLKRELGNFGTISAEADALLAAAPAMLVEDHMLKLADKINK